MNGSNRLQPVRGVVLSDLHLFARRSQAADCLHALQHDLASARLLVLNGDIFDFRWSTLGNLDKTMDSALDWLSDLCRSFPQCEVHYVLGNHDGLSKFRSLLAARAAKMPRLHCHEHGVRLADALFLHGDCTDRKMNPMQLRQRRARWEHDRPRGNLATASYIAADRLGLTHFVMARHFPPHQTVERVVHYLNHAWPGWRQNIRHCYFGHTHLPFSDYHLGGVMFHNTGSAIRGLRFNPIIFPAHTRHSESMFNTTPHVCTC